MRYTYAYKTSDGTRHEGAIEATSRDEAFASLRRQGIKPIKVVAADGSKANGEIRGVRRRVLVAAVVIVSASVGAAMFWLGRARTSDAPLGPALAAVSPRHQIYGDPDVVGAFERGRFESVLPRAGDRLLAWFAQPGRMMVPKGTSPAELYTMDEARATELQAAISEVLTIAESDSREVRELKQIVNGMHQELRDYLAGGGTVKSYWHQLHERTRQEMDIYNRVFRELKDEKSLEVWDEKNDALRRIGLRTIPHPSEIQ